MLLSKSDVLFAFGTLQSSLPAGYKDTGVEVSNKRAASVSTACLLGLTACKALQSVSWISRGFGALLLIELGFYLYQRNRYQAVNALVPVPLDKPAILRARERFLELESVFTLEQFLCGWFFGAPFSSIRRGNVEELIAYGFYTTRLQELSEEDKRSINDFIDECQVRWDVQLPPGYQQGLRYMAHLWEPLRVVYKPLVLHLGSEIAHMVCASFLRMQGFTPFPCQGFRCWVKQPVAGNSGTSPAASTPIVFIHGVGLGVLPYLHLLQALSQACPASTVVLLELPAVSLRLGQRAADVDAIAAAAVAAAVQHASLPACFVAHSFGTFCVSRICQLHPAAVQSVALMDPVCMMTCFPQLLHNFVYKLPSMAECFSSIAGLVNGIRWLVARDMIIAETFCRKFLWHELILWPHDMPQRTLLALSAQDDLVPSTLVVGQCHQAASPARLLLHPTAGHGGQLMDSAFLRCFVAQTAALVLQQPSPPFSAYAPQLPRPCSPKAAAAAKPAPSQAQQAQMAAAAAAGARPSLASVSVSHSPALLARQPVHGMGKAVLPVPQRRPAEVMRSQAGR